MGNEIETAKEYRAKAAELRDKAAQVEDEGIRELLLRVALDYERMANAVVNFAKARKSGNRRSDTD